jgi:uncharacterized protein
MMARAALQSKPADLDALQAFLMSGRAPESSMGLSALDGFVTAIAVGPETIVPSEWLPVVWGGEKPIFAGPDEAHQVTSIIMARYDEIVAGLQEGGGSWTPAFRRTPESELIVTDWAAGFLDAVDIRADAWTPLFEDRDAAVLLVPILLAGGEAEIAYDMGLEATYEAAWLHAALDHIPQAVIAIDNPAPASPIRSARRTSPSGPRPRLAGATSSRSRTRRRSVPRRRA